MLDSIYGIYGTFRDHPYLALAIFISGTLMITWRYSDNGLITALLSMLRVFGYAFRVPHEFMRTCLKNFDQSESMQEPYVGTREYVLHKFNQLQFLFAFVAGLLILSAGATAALIALYPKAEMERRDKLGQALEVSNQSLSDADVKVIEISSPDFEKNISKKRVDLQTKFTLTSNTYSTFYSQIGYNAPIIREIDSAYYNDEFRDNAAWSEKISNYFVDCPDGESWTDFTQEMCNDMLDKVTKLYQLKIETLDAESKFDEVVVEERNVPAALEAAKEIQAELKKKVSSDQKSFDKAALSNGAWIKSHLKAALGLLSLALLQFLVYTWGYALLTYFVSWIAHIMRSLEKKAQD